MKKSYYIKTFGCQMNLRDSEIIAQSLWDHGYTPASEIFGADIIVINTCSIRAKAEQKVMSLLGMLRKIKNDRPQLKICISGCVAQQEGGKILERMPHVDLIVGTQNVHAIPELLDRLNGKSQVVISMSNTYEIPIFIPNLSKSTPLQNGESPFKPFKSFVTIMQGCNNFCAYCVVPYTRGREVSRNKKDIIDEVKALVDVGVKEITLLGQNVNSYGLTNKVNDTHYSFPSLLEDIANISGLKRIRFTTSHPKDLSDELMRCFVDISILCRQIHLPVQAGSDFVLARMNRKYTIAYYLKKVEALRNYCPDIAITTDVIVGFPGETDNDFEQTLALLEEVRYDGSFSFKYSDRPGTKSCNLDGKVPEEVKGIRLNTFQSRQNQISLQNNNALVGKTLPVMIESIKDQGFNARTEYNHVVHGKNSISAEPGDIVDVFIYHAGQHSLLAKKV